MSQCVCPAPEPPQALQHPHLQPQNTGDAPSWLTGSIPDGAPLSAWPLPQAPALPWGHPARSAHTCCSCWTPQLHSHGRKGRTNPSHLYFMDYFPSHLNYTATRSCRRSSPNFTLWHQQDQKTILCLLVTLSVSISNSVFPV